MWDDEGRKEKKRAEDERRFIARGYPVTVSV